MIDSALSNQVLTMEITYISMARSSFYRGAVMDWFTPRILARSMSNTLEAYYCDAEGEQALARYGTGEIANIDQGSLFTLRELKNAGGPRDQD